MERSANFHTLIRGKRVLDLHAATPAITQEDLGVRQPWIVPENILRDNGDIVQINAEVRRLEVRGNYPKMFQKYMYVYYVVSNK